jgi:hypothetical protein
MTLILTTVHRHCVTQVADRLVTRRGREQFDPDANKTVLFFARDAFVTLGYSGPAYIDRRPTDQWIAETLRDRPVILGHDGRSPAVLSCNEQIANWPSVHEAVARLVKGLEEASRQSPAVWRAVPLDIVIAGWQQYRRKRPRAFALTISNAPGCPTVVKRLSRHFGRGVWLVTAPDGYLLPGEQIALNDVVRQVTPAEAERAMVAQIRNVAARTSTVGPHCMCVSSAARVWGVRIRYDSPNPDMGDLISDRVTVPIPIAFSPWIVTEHQTMAPSIIIGIGPEVRAGRWRIQIEGTGERCDPGAPWVQFGQNRPPQP